MRVPLLRRLATLATALGLTSLGLLGAAAAPAQAAISDCPSGYFCAWKTDNGTGTMYRTTADQATLGAWDNTFRSVVNRTNKYACLYDDPNHGTSGMVGVLDPDPAGTEWVHDQGNVSSLKFVATSRECVSPAYPAWYASPAPEAQGFADMNGDAQADVVVRDKAGRLWFLRGDGSGQLIGNSGWNVFNGLVRHGDYSGDGHEDVIAREASTGRLWLYTGTGSGTLSGRTLIGNSGWNAMSRLVGYGDLTGDGRTDLLAVEKSTGRLWLYPGTSTGSLGARKLIGNGGWNAMNALVGAGDMNGDGRPDLIAREASTGKLWLYPGGTGALGARVLVGSGGWNVMEHILGLGDVTGDGNADLATSTTSAFANDTCRGVGCHLVYRGRGTGSLQPGEVVADDWHHLNGIF
ncbi:FG-GAP-like repeat-containing protein [Streptomyces fradiae]|uniref:FG-GAP-like repeat-containing protein n=1 Tax=Streptomyces fradiae TaxID=1906 RepID=UPI0029435538|nr:FG-GAP-like repeat-containing protein [Streptomyces fradiae]WOI58821.1 FG-GAP-like repeat-containing protein [Streptomyces fradiae]